MRPSVWIGVLAFVALAGCGGILAPTASECAGLPTTGNSYDSATVTVTDRNGSTLGIVDAGVADSPREHCIGLSNTESLASNEGMLFVFEETATRSFVMRDMAFPLDIIFVAANGTITQIHSAPRENPPLTEYEGRGRYVLEVPRGWTTDNGVEVGDRVLFEYDDP